MRSRRPHGSGLLLVPAAAFLVHQLRYTLAYGSRANAELAAQGHSYLSSLVPWFVLALGLALALFVRRAARSLRGRETGRVARAGGLALWAGTWAGLVAIYAVQESLEALLASGHPGGIGGVLGHGGWWAIPVAAVVAVGVLALLRVARVVLRAAARRAPRRAWVQLAVICVPAGIAGAAVAPLARAAAGRAPPFASTVH
jgi:hypothetical protein